MLRMTSFPNPQRDQSQRTQGANQHTGIMFFVEKQGRDPMPIPIFDHVTGGVRQKRR